MDRLDLHTEVTQYLDDAVGIGLLFGIIHDQTLVLITSEEIEGGERGSDGYGSTGR